MTIGEATIAGNPFFGGVPFPTVVFGVLYAWPALERRLTGDHARHDLPDRLLVDLGFPYEGQVWFFRILALAGPFLVFVFTLRICRELKASEARPLRRWEGTVVRREPDVRYVEVEVSGNGASRGAQREGERRSGEAGDG